MHCYSNNYKIVISATILYISSSMEPNLLIGDRLFVTKYTYGYSKHSFPFGPNLSQKECLF